MARTPGPPPTPTALRLLRDDPGHRPFNMDEPTPEALQETCPPRLAKNDLAREEWETVIVPAIRSGHITESDRAQAIMHCKLFATWVSQDEEADKHPHIVAVGPNKYPTPNPARSQANKTAALLMACDQALGLTPTSRTRVQVRGPKIGQGGLSAARARFGAGTRG